MDNLKEMDNATFVIYSPRRGCLLAPSNRPAATWADEVNVGRDTRFRLFSRTEGEAFLKDLLTDTPDVKLMTCITGKDYALPADLNSHGIPYIV